MHIKEGTKLKVYHNVKGEFYAAADRGFDTVDEFYPLVVLQPVTGRNNKFKKGQTMVVRSNLCTVRVEES